MIGQVVSHYRVLRRIGEGAMGVVYLAEDLVLHRQVALKFLPVDLAADPEARSRFEHEARTVASLFHPNIGPLFEIGSIDDSIFLVLAHLEGRTLRERLRDGPLPQAEALRIAAEMADALAAVHARGIVHRDFKPANIMLTADGRSVLMDFGIAHVAGATRMTRTGATLGTVAYMAPEQVEGGAPDARGDLWALGVVLHEMLTGRQPFTGGNEGAVLYAIVHEEPDLRPTPTLPAGIGVVVGRALEKDPARRYATAAELRADIEDCIRDGAAMPAGSPTRRAPRFSRRGPVRWVAAAVGIALVTGVALWVGSRLWNDAPGGRGGGRPQGLAVLPLENLSGDPAQEYLADGMTEELISQLSQVGGLKVIARSSVMQFKGSHHSLPEVAKTLGVDRVIEGSVLRAREDFRINAQLVDPRTSSNLWAQRYDGRFRDALSMQDEVARAIVHAIQVQLTPDEAARLARIRRVDPLAHDAYLLGRYEWNKQTKDGGMQAIAHYRRALAIEPGYALAWVGLADAYYTMSNFFLPPDSAMPQVRAAAARAAAIDSKLGDAHTLLGVVHAQYDWDWKKAEREYRRAIELSPSSSVAHRWYAYYLGEMGRWAEARREYRKCIELDPATLLNRWLATWPDFFEGHYDRAIVDLEAILETDSTFFPAWSLLGESLEMKGDFPGALRALDRGIARGGNTWVVFARARVFARMGRTAEARRLIAPYEHARLGEAYVSPYGLASVYARLGDPDRAFALLERGVRERCEDLPLLNVDPRMAVLHGDPRFHRMVAGMDLVGGAPAD